LVLLLFVSNLFAREVLVATAANVRYAMDELKEAFEKKSGISVRISVASSGKLAAMIKSGAPFDLFLSADMKYPSYLHKEGLTVNKPEIYAFGSLVVWSLKLGKRDIEKGVWVLKEKGIKRIAVANPRNAPYGFEAVKALKRASVYDEIKNKLIYGESIAQTSQYIASKIADVGLTAKSIVLSPKMKGKGVWMDVNSSLYEPIAQGAVLLKNSENLKDAEAFYNFLFSEEAKKIFRKYGYEVK